ncbi:Endoplasmic reticulum oxidoreductin-1 [Penicillium atrosanguineum]|uniref:Endoplasmic reticulum oxidoreductin-1 n=1 Tax=Penicillium atrosanguineum TaxID=1132637 RepID=UPI002385189A|nr:Endoplasmic reticulum oxidoreductin-1 [Penicillium atrosanguineum]KAJ5117284.1 hypothetical protein N7526_011393 [Penicillium atrosanguineum]KAJ5310725.1 Endoplasmic reticulum oxidoreductin-1 [Penicillium atrosanguineum]
MSLVQYSESDSESNAEPVSPPSKKPRLTTGASLPPLPPAFHDLYASGTRVSVKDDPSLHGGRKRVVPHVEGNWPSHLYLEWYPAKNELALLADLIAQAQGHSNGQSIHSLLHSDLGAQLPLHISLSRPVVLRTEQRSSFTELLQKSIRGSHIAPFSVLPDTLTWVSNYEKTRWFLVLHVARPQNNELNNLLHLSNRALASFDQPPLYAPSRDSRPRASSARDRQRVDYSDCFHISIAWSLTGPAEEDVERVQGIDLIEVKGLEVRFDSVKAKIGNHVESISLSKTT